MASRALYKRVGAAPSSAGGHPRRPSLANQGVKITAPRLFATRPYLRAKETARPPARGIEITERLTAATRAYRIFADVRKEIP
jgi:hypothetical protein